MNDQLYPPSPSISNYEFAKPTPAFKSAAVTVMMSIVLFLLFYLLLLAISGIILVLSIWGGVSIITFRTNAITLAAGLGLIALGLMFFTFLIKFIFSRTKDENPFRTELKEKEHPELFSFIRNITEETKTKFPKKIFVSPDVNAAVFYNSSFWSMFFPVRKNLEIGLGLVNTLNISEFKSVLAHEFGHFSQRSMKLGSYIYTVNRAIYNLVYEHDRWDDLLAKWVSGGGVFGFFAKTTSWLAGGVRSLLKVAYSWVNVRYMKLSREMEYHADLVAVSVSGNEAFKAALRKIEFSSFAYNYTTTYLNRLASGNKASQNLFQDHTATLSFLAERNKLTEEGMFSDEDIANNLVKSRVVVKDQWASHPTLLEREENIARVNLTCPVYTDSAWKLFQDAHQLQIQVTQHLYTQGFPEQKFENLNAQEFKQYVADELNKYHISDAYLGFYDDRYLTDFELKPLINTAAGNDTFHEIYSPQHVEKIKRHHANQSDITLLTQISLKQVPVRHFEFDGEKYKRKEAKPLIHQLKQEMEKDAVDIEALDKKSFQFNYRRAEQKNQEKALVTQYLSLFSSQSSLKQSEDINNQLRAFTSRLYGQQQWTEDAFALALTELTSIEKSFKNFLQTLNIDALLTHVEESQKNAIQEYVDKNFFYSKASTFDEQGFLDLNNLVYDVHTATANQYGTTLKRLTDFQISPEDHQWR